MAKREYREETTYTLHEWTLIKHVAECKGLSKAAYQRTVALQDAEEYMRLQHMSDTEENS
jgi:hypothetical protein